MVYTGDLKSPGRKAMWVRLPPRAQPTKKFSLAFLFRLLHNKKSFSKIYIPAYAEKEV